MSQPREPWETLEPDDGYRVVALKEGDLREGLYLVCRSGGDLVPMKSVVSAEELTYVPLLQADVSTPEGRAAVERARPLFEAVARYLTLGGELRLSTLGAFFSFALPLGLPGMHLLESYPDVNGDWTHVFIKDGDSVGLRWVEGQFVDRVTLEQLLREREEEGPGGDEEDGGGGERPRLPAPGLPGPEEA